MSGEGYISRILNVFIVFYLVIRFGGIQSKNNFEIQPKSYIQETHGNINYHAKIWKCLTVGRIIMTLSHDGLLCIH